MATKLLVADDSLTIQKIIRLALSNQGYDIQTVSDGNEALEQMALFRPEIILLDLTLPGKDAFELAVAIRGMGPEFAHVKTVLLSSISEAVDETRAAEAGFHGRLSKPFDPASLRKVLASVLESPNSPPAATALAPPPPPPRAPTSPPPTPAMTPPQAPSPTAAAAVPMGELEPVTSDEGPSRAPPPPSAPPPMPKFVAPPSPPPPPPPVAAVEIEADAKSSGSGTLGDPIELSPITEEPSMVLSTSPSLPPAPVDFSDIKQLTESTIRMSGLEEFDWSVQETGRKADDALSPPPFAPPASPPPLPEAGEPNPFSSFESPSALADFGNSDFPLTRPTPTPDFGPTGMVDAPPIAPPPPSADYFGPPGGDGQPLPVSSEHLEELIQKQVELALTRYAQQMLPDIAEKVIKQEIRKMLLEPGAGG